MPSSSSAEHALGALPTGARPLSGLAGVGPVLAATLARRGLLCLQDLWFTLPLRYEDLTSVMPIAALRPGQRAQVEGVVTQVETGFRFRPLLQVAIEDGSSAALVLRFIHFRRVQAAQFAPGMRVRAYGEVREGHQGLEIVHPRYRVLGTQAPQLATHLSAVYPLTEGITNARMASLVTRALAQLPCAEELELLPPVDSAALALPDLRSALLAVHQPAPDDDLAALLAGTHPAQRRLAFEELLAQHLALRQLRQRARSHVAPVCADGRALMRRLRAGLPYALTGAQQRVLDEILADLAAPRPMLRLVQGDVGSGKTIVAALAALVVVASGRQVALAAPTELLAEQHYRSFSAWLQPLGIEVLWLAGKVQGRARNAALARLTEGAAVCVGTHALMQEGVRFRNLGLAIVDEQHRFGVHQRLSLVEKGSSAGEVPHQLVLTATPIPRTLAMTAYADLDISVLDELPPGRTPVQTTIVAASRRAEVVERIRHACAKGRQAYWVCTLVEESDVLAAQAAEVAHVELSAALPTLSVGLVHGRMKPAAKQAVMNAFKHGELALLVATTVIEVGVDVPNASLMVIENAERLGLAQLHQLRGRIGRGSTASNCVLLYQPPLSANARARLTLLRESNDGFRIAEMDLKLRGAGEMLGTRQTGLLALRVADLVRDADLLPMVRELADRLLQDDHERVELILQRWFGSARRYAQA
ncbi:ATP-dependent DNA helicase RecG [Metallibacterium sp.]|uniref:ATP-dependent DNA helicase RecG n=1 Tax=Metallibacterium sp. TaxID=2940281 RepID=UPI002617CD5D|nr:ATP-dependent DNA helicase RecG [Metallibacterium sp.]